MYSLNPYSDNCYEGTTCLVNKLGIRDEKIYRKSNVPNAAGCTTLIIRNVRFANMIIINKPALQKGHEYE